MFYVWLEIAIGQGDWVAAEGLRNRIKGYLMEDIMGIKLRSREGEELEEEQAGIYHMGKENINGGRCSLAQLRIRGNGGGGLLPLANPQGGGQGGFQ